MQVEIDIRPVLKTLRTEFADLTNSRFNLAVARAINHTMAKAKTGTSRDIRGQYNVKAKELKSSLALWKASRLNLEGMLIATGRPLPIMAFGARQSFTSVKAAKGTRKTIKSGVTVNIMGQNTRLPSAFIATMASGHTGVFARGKYQGYSFQWRDERERKTGNDLVINELTTTSVPKMMQNNAVLNNLKRGLETDFPSRLRHELNYLLSKSSPQL